MTTKTPSGLAATGTTTSDEETIDDSLDDILMHANERSGDGLPARPVPQLQLPRPSSATLLGVPLSSLPIPSSSLSRAELDPMSRSAFVARDEVTQIARSALLDDLPDEEEDTKVRPLEAARQAAASMDDLAVDVGLTDQASAERDRALRKSSPPGGRLAADPAFADPDTDGASQALGATPRGIAIQDDDNDESTANGRGPLSGAGLQSPPVNPRLASPTLYGRPEPFGSRLPTPSSAAPSASFGSVPSSGPAYAPAPPSPGYAPPVVSSAFGGQRSSVRSIPIPAPSGAPATSVARSPFFSKVQLPVGGLVAFLIAAFSGGLIAGAMLWRGTAAEPPIVMAVPVAPPPMPVVQPVLTPPQGTVEVPVNNGAPVPPTAEPLPPPAEPTPAFPTTETPFDDSRVARRAAASASAANTPSTTPKPPRARKASTTPGGGKQVDGRGVAKGWVDPFAE
jgi:hypothetical protein